MKLGDFDLGERIGSGAMGDVYRARQVSLDRAVAVKLLPERLASDPVSRARFEREARAAARLVHPNVVQVHAIGCEDGVPYLVMELVQGPDLEHVLAARGRLPVPEALAVVRGVANALACAAEHGVVHRDLKPANLKVDPRGAVKVMDFGLALLAGAARVSAANSLLGSPSYLSPEQCRGEDPDARSDLYALGVVLYRMLTGRLPIRGRNLPELVLAHGNQTPEPPGALVPGLPAGVEALCLSLLAKDPSGRPSSAASVLATLDELGPDGRGRARGWPGVVALLRQVAHALAGRRPRPSSSPPMPAASPEDAAPPPPRPAAPRPAAAEPPPSELRARIRGFGPDDGGRELGPADAEVEREVLARIRDGSLAVPLLPESTLQTLAVLDDPRSGLEDVARVVFADPALAAQVLARANAADLDGGTRVGDPALAVARLGLRRLRAHLLALATRLVVLKGASGGPTGRAVWWHSLGCAVLARALARAAGEDPETAFLAGLIHDVGAFVVLEAAVAAARARRADVPDEGALRTIARRHHEAAGARVAAAWHLPDELRAAIVEHHEPRPEAPRLAHLVALADRLCREDLASLGSGYSGLAARAGVTPATIADLAPRLDALLSEAEARFAP